MDGYYGFVEFLFVVLFVGAYFVLEWQGRRLDRAKAEREAKEKAANSASS